MRVYSAREPKWDCLTLLHGNRVVAEVLPDPDWPNMWRARIGDRLTDMVNRTRAKDAAMCLALGILNTRERCAEASPIRYFEQAVSAVMAST